jgi:hypothetical protein
MSRTGGDPGPARWPSEEGSGSSSWEYLPRRGALINRDATVPGSGFDPGRVRHGTGVRVAETKVVSREDTVASPDQFP